MFSYYRVASATPKVQVANISYNLEQIIEVYHNAVENNVALIVFPELSITAYTCGDLFFQQKLLKNAWFALEKFAKETAKNTTVAVVGLPIIFHDAIYNVAAVVQKGKICGLVPKSILPNYREFYEKRQFCSGKNLHDICYKNIPFGTDLLFELDEDFTFGIEICEDLWGVIPPSCKQTSAGAKVIVNLSASNELVTKESYRRDLVKQQSARCICTYILSSAGVHESTSDVLFGGHNLIANNGQLLAENRPFNRENSIIYADIDIEKLSASRFSESSFNDFKEEFSYRTIILDKVNESTSLEFAYNNAYPFVPQNEEFCKKNCNEILDIQVNALAKRLEHTNTKNVVIGISGGLDSTLALLVVSRCFKLLNLDAKGIVCFTMPGFGTTGRTYQNAVKLTQILGTNLKEVNIKEASLLHFKDIEHDPKILDVTYENVQARERTQILMDYANKISGLVIGTGDLSELALGWCTYNGDHMSMYAVNCSIPKTLIRFLIKNISLESSKELQDILNDIIDTPVSPELLPPNADGKIQQKTEEIIGSYDLHDFFLYHTIKYGSSPEKILYLANNAFKDKFSPETIANTLKIFIKRFFTQQFKRNCIPDGPKVGTISLSPRGDWRMPSDASFKEFIQDR